MNIIDIINEKDTTESYKTFVEKEIDSYESNEYYSYFDDFLKMLNNDNSYVRVRCFRMICSLSKWDIDNKIDKNIDKILLELDDEKPTAVRQCLKALRSMLLYKTNLSDVIEDKLRKLDYSKYKDSMSPLIKKDIDEILSSL